jgi:integrase
MSSIQLLLDAAGRRRSPATTPGFHAGRSPRNKGQRYPADPPTVDEIVAVMRQVGHDRDGHRLSALIVVLWRAGLRIQEALSLTETDLDQRRRVDFGQTRKERSSARGRHGRLGLVGDHALARRPPRASGWAALLRDRRTDMRPQMVS